MTSATLDELFAHGPTTGEPAYAVPRMARRRVRGVRITALPSWPLL